MVIEQEDISRTADKISICEKKLVEESGTVKSRYSPLCRQVGVVCCFLILSYALSLSLSVMCLICKNTYRLSVSDRCWNWQHVYCDISWHGNRLFGCSVARTTTARKSYPR